ncbi:MAG: SDR family oxidoreductase [bacterium]
MDLRITGKCAAVAGATKGLGFATAKALAAEGVRVAICGRDPERLQRAVSEIGTDAIGIRQDVSTPADAAEFVEEAIRQLGQVDILVPNAGGPSPGAPTTTSIEAYQEALNLNLFSTIAMCNAALPGMRERGWGRIVAITSHAVRQPSAFIAASVTARTGITGYLKVLSNEVAAEGVTVNSAQPGAHSTDRMKELGVDLDQMAKTIPLGFLGDAAQFGEIVAFMCSESTSFVTGTSVLVDGGAYPGLM